VLKVGNLLLKLLVLFIFALLLSQRAYAINLGSLVKSDFAQISIGESAKFKILFWNSEEDSYEMRLSVKNYPEGWTVIIDPDEFILNRSVGEEYISLPYMNDNIRAKVVNIFIKPDEKSLTGNYSIAIESYAITNFEGVLSVLPKNSFQLKVSLKGIETQENNDIPLEVSEEKDIEVFEHVNDTQQNKSITYMFFIIIVVIASLVVYKKY